MLRSLVYRARFTVQGMTYFIRKHNIYYYGGGEGEREEKNVIERKHNRSAFLFVFFFSLPVRIITRIKLLFIFMCATVEWGGKCYRNKMRFRWVPVITAIPWTDKWPIKITRFVSRKQMQWYTTCTRCFSLYTRARSSRLSLKILITNIIFYGQSPYDAFKVHRWQLKSFDYV